MNCHLFHGVIKKIMKGFNAKVFYKEKISHAQICCLLTTMTKQTNELSQNLDRGRGRETLQMLRNVRRRGLLCLLAGGAGTRREGRKHVHAAVDVKGKGQPALHTDRKRSSSDMPVASQRSTPQTTVCPELPNVIGHTPGGLCAAALLRGKVMSLKQAWSGKGGGVT